MIVEITKRGARSMKKETSEYVIMNRLYHKDGTLTILFADKHSDDTISLILNSNEIDKMKRLIM